MLSRLFILGTIFLATGAFAQGYEIPTKDPKLEKYSRYNVQNLEITLNANAIKVEYQLPVELTGVVNTLEFSGSLKKPTELKGENGQMLCKNDAANAELFCTVYYEELEFDLNKVQEILAKDLTLSAEDRLNKLALAREFSTEPIGVLKIKLKK